MFGVDAVFAERLAVVGSDDDGRLLADAVAFQRREQFRDFGVDPPDAGVVAVDELFDVRAVGDRLGHRPVVERLPVRPVL